MKIAIDIRNIGKQRTGSEVVVLELTKEILNLDKDNEYLLVTDTDDKDVLTNIKNDLKLENKKNARIVSLKAKNKFVWVAITMPIFFRTHKIDIFHTEYIIPFFIPKKVKVVTHIHDVSFKVYREMILRKDLFFLDLLIPRSISRSDKIIAVSQFTRDEILKYYKVDPDKIEVIYNSINVTKKVSTQESIEAVRKKYQLPQKFILYIGTLQPRKNIPTLIEAYAKIENKIPEIELVIAGDKKAHNFDKKIDEAIFKYKLDKKIKFTGFIETEDKASVYRMAQVFVFPSFYEGFGIPILEAMSQGVPILASDIGPHREVAAEAGSYFKFGDIDIFSNKLYNICVDQNERKRLSDLGISRAKFFSWKKSAQALLKVFNSFK